MEKLSKILKLKNRGIVLNFGGEIFIEGLIPDDENEAKKLVNLFSEYLDTINVKTSDIRWTVV